VGFDPEDPLAFDFDTAIMARGMIFETETNEKIARNRPSSGAPGVEVIEAEDLDPGIVLRG